MKKKLVFRGNAANYVRLSNVSIRTGKAKCGDAHLQFWYRAQARSTGAGSRGHRQR